LVVCAIIVRDGKILLEKRAPAGIVGLDGSWDLPGGKVEAKETPRRAIEREISEELGVRVRCTRLLPEPLPSVWQYAQGERHWLLVGCVCEIEQGEPKTTESLQWFAGTELPETLLSADRTLIEDYMQSQRERAAEIAALKAQVAALSAPVDVDEVNAFAAETCIDAWDMVKIRLALADFVKSRIAPPSPAQQTGWEVVPDSEVGFVAHSVAHLWCNGHGVTKEAAIKMASENLESLRCSSCGAVDGERVPVPSGGKLSERPAPEASAALAPLPADPAKETAHDRD
jgi:8-oxo-dGTP diphosphatase